MNTCDKCLDGRHHRCHDRLCACNVCNKPEAKAWAKARRAEWQAEQQKRRSTGG